MSLKLTKAMILAAGQGKRLWPLTSSVAKSALPLLGRPLVEYVLRSLKRSGFRQVVVNLHHQFESVESSLRRAPQELVVHRSLEPQLLGTAGGLKRAAQYFENDKTFLLVNADTLVGVDINQIVRAHYDSNAVATLLLRPKVPGDRYSEIVLDESGFISAKKKFSTGHWLKMVIRKIKILWKKDKTPIVVGGTGLYFKALIDGLVKIPKISNKKRLAVRKLQKKS